LLTGKSFQEKIFLKQKKFELFYARRFLSLQRIVVKPEAWLMSGLGWQKGFHGNWNSF